MGYLGMMVFFMLILFLGIVIIGLPKIFSPKNPIPVKYEPYECGEVPQGEAWSRYNIRFYLLAIAFVIFDVEAAFLFVWVLKSKELGVSGFIEVFIFVLILFVGWIYILRKEVIKWA